METKPITSIKLATYLRPEEPYARKMFDRAQRMFRLAAWWGRKLHAPVVLLWALADKADLLVLKLNDEWFARLEHVPEVAASALQRFYFWATYPIAWPGYQLVKHADRLRKKYGVEKIEEVWIAEWKHEVLYSTIELTPAETKELYEHKG